MPYQAEFAPQDWSQIKNLGLGHDVLDGRRRRTENNALGSRRHKCLIQAGKEMSPRVVVGNNEFGAAPHTDFDFMTIPDPRAGEIRPKGKHWIRAHALPDCFNTGDPAPAFDQ